MDQAPEAGDQPKVCEQSPALLKLDSEEAPFSWSDEVEMSVLSKLSSSPGDSNANNVTIPGESTAMQPQNGNASYKRTESPTTRSERTDRMVFVSLKEMPVEVEIGGLSYWLISGRSRGHTSVTFKSA
uniref:Uncharacterized protein n=1 Tax=Ascaris lumbricoides TaxID=6252 RepID=A0A0M3ISL1_ASCLU